MNKIRNIFLEKIYAYKFYCNGFHSPEQVKNLWYKDTYY